LPEQSDYEAFDLATELELTTDESRVSQMLLADVSGQRLLYPRIKIVIKLYNNYPKTQASIRKYACWFDFECLLASEDPTLTSIDPANMTDAQKERLEALVLFVTQANTDAITAAKDNLQFTTADQLAQGATTLASITSNVNGELGKTLDMVGRQAAVDMIAVSVIHVIHLFITHSKGCFLLLYDQLFLRSSWPTASVRSRRTTRPS
jgi:hypothetical protein